MKNEDFETLRELIKSLQKPKRFKHTLGVEKEARLLGELLLPDKVEELAIAGILHDITKELTTEAQLRLCKEYGISVAVDYAPKLFHAITGCEFARRKLGAELVTDEIYNGIRYHTTGRENMTLFEQIIYLADYIEENRDFEDCILLRNYFYDNIKNANEFEQKIDVLTNTMVLSFDLTIKNLIQEERAIDFDTIKARNYFLKSRRENG